MCSKVFNPLSISPNLDDPAKSLMSVSEAPSPSGRGEELHRTFCGTVKIEEGEDDVEEPLLDKRSRLESIHL